MDWVAEHPSATYFAVCSRLIGPEVKVTIEQSLPGNLSATDWADLRELLSAIQSGLPDAADRSPGEVFRYALDALTMEAQARKRISASMNFCDSWPIQTCTISRTISPFGSRCGISRISIFGG